MNDKKIVEYLNLNITFDGKPLLSRFSDIFIPAISENYLHLKKYNYVFKNLEIKEIEGEYVLVGIIIKDTVLEVNTVLDDKKDKLIKKDDKINSSPYSIFVLFLKDHRMLLVKNQKGSPNISNLKTAFSNNLNKYIRDYNRKLKKKIKSDLNKQNLNTDEMKKKFIDIFSEKRLPYPIIDIMGISSKEEVVKIIKQSELKNIKFKFSPINGDITSYNVLFGDIEKELVNKLDTQVVLDIGGSDKKDEVIKLVVDTEDLVDTSITVKKADGTVETISPDRYIKKTEFSFESESVEGQLKELLLKSKHLNLNRRLESHSEYDEYLDDIKRVKEKYDGNN